jgi:hypothetical protein
MTAVDRYLQELGNALCSRGRIRRRLLAECQAHLADAAATSSDEEAVSRFGSAADLARSFDTEIAARRAVRATVASIVGVVAVGASTVSLLNGADRLATAEAVWVVVFFPRRRRPLSQCCLRHCGLRPCDTDPQHLPTPRCCVAGTSRPWHFRRRLCSPPALPFPVTPLPGRCLLAQRRPPSPRSSSVGLARWHDGSNPIQGVAAGQSRRCKKSQASKRRPARRNCCQLRLAPRCVGGNRLRPDPTHHALPHSGPEPERFALVCAGSPSRIFPASRSTRS